MKSMKLYERLSAHNEVHDPNQSTDNDEFLENRYEMPGYGDLPDFRKCHV